MTGSMASWPSARLWLPAKTADKSLNDSGGEQDL